MGPAGRTGRGTVGSVGEVHSLPAGRELFADDRGRGLRATWHPEDQVVVLSFWREARCEATFTLAPADAARLAGLLVAALGDAAVGASGASPPVAAGDA
jgi:hypothetical protein